MGVVLVMGCLSFQTSAWIAGKCIQKRSQISLIYVLAEDNLRQSSVYGYLEKRIQLNKDDFTNPSISSVLPVPYLRLL